MPAGDSKRQGQGQRDSPPDTSSAKPRKPEGWDTLQDVFADIDKRRKTLHGSNKHNTVTIDHIKAFREYARDGSQCGNLLVQAETPKFVPNPDLIGELAGRVQRKRYFDSIANSAATLSSASRDEEKIAEELRHFAEGQAKIAIIIPRTRGRDSVEAIKRRRTELRRDLLDETKEDKRKLKEDLKEVRDVVGVFGFRILTRAPLVRSLPSPQNNLPSNINTFLKNVKKRNSVGSDDLTQLKKLIAKNGTTVDDRLKERVESIEEMLLVEQHFESRDLETEEHVQWRRMEAVGKRITNLYEEHDGLVKFESENEQLSSEEKTLIAMLKAVIAYRVRKWQYDDHAELFSLSDVLKQKFLEMEKENSHDVQQRRQDLLDIALAFEALVSLTTLFY